MKNRRDPYSESARREETTLRDETTLREHPTEPVGCRLALPHLHAYVEGELDPIRCQLVEEHLESCGTCRREAEELKVERVVFMEACISSPELPTDFTTRVMHRVRTESVVRGRAAKAGWLRLSGVAAAALLMATAAVVLDGEGGRQAVVSSMASDALGTATGSRLERPPCDYP